MASTIIEQIRSNMEDIEIYEKTICECLLEIDEKVKFICKSHYYQPKDKIILEHKIKVLLEKIQNKSLNVISLQRDQDGLKQSELGIFSGN